MSTVTPFVSTNNEELMKTEPCWRLLKTWIDSQSFGWHADGLQLQIYGLTFMANDVKSLAHSQNLAPLSILPSAHWSADGARDTERVITLSWGVTNPSRDKRHNKRDSKLLQRLFCPWSSDVLTFFRRVCTCKSATISLCFKSSTSFSSKSIQYLQNTVHYPLLISTVAICVNVINFVRCQGL